MKAAGTALAIAITLTAAIPGHAATEDRSAGDLYLMLIQQARADGRPRAALAYLADYERRYPSEVGARILKINCLLDLGQLQAAEAEAEALPSDVPGDAAEAVRGHVLAAKGEWLAATARYRKALDASPADPLLGNALGYALLRAGHAGKAVETLKAAADLAPGDRIIRNNLLLALTLAGRGREAQTILTALPDAGLRSALALQLAEEARRLSDRQSPESGA